MKKFIKILVCAALLSALLLTSLVSCGRKAKEAKYTEALQLIESGEYEEAYRLFSDLDGYKDSEDYLSGFRYYTLNATRKVNGTERGAEITYNEDNFPCKVKAYRADGSSVTYEFSYDEKGNMIHQTTYDFDGSVYEFDYLYDEDGRYVAATCEPLNDVFPSREYFYDQEDNVVKQIHSYADGKTIVYESVYEDGKETVYSVTNKDGTVRRCEFLYDESGYMIKENCFEAESADSPFKPCSVYEYAFNDNGDMIKEIYTDENGDVHCVDYVYTDGNLIKEIYTEPDGGQSFTDNTYDSNGMLIKSVYTDADGSQTVTEYTRDEAGNVIKEVYTNEEGNQRITETEYIFVYTPYELTDMARMLIESVTSIRWAND